MTARTGRRELVWSWLCNRLPVWLDRYVPAECASLLAAWFGATFVLSLTGSEVAAALGATWLEAAAYYSTVLVRDMRATRHVGQSPTEQRDARPCSWRAIGPQLRDLVLEFGVAKVLDALVVRPTLMYGALHLVPNLTVAVLLGKLGADLVFYVPTIAAYELREVYAKSL